MTTIKPLFIRTSNGILNASAGTTVVHFEDATLILDAQCRKIIFDNSEKSHELFEKAKQRVKPQKDYSIVLENGGFIDVRIIKNTFVSPKTGHLLVIGLNERPLCIFDKEQYSDISGLSDAITDVLIDISDDKKVSAIQWAEYQK
ncbi:hypothetical protein PE36_07352 [Moritella sp. PE36]|uniref:hypothetical protein n=1 Tax=Moritella sp. PE36 TaxID=58051 RepID=UPI00015689C6|nr:hypothetical protein [Moritella sp. PE36]EDM69285.1 hypothetical protein PE36_07352 [Moritella sp. PE36]